MFEWRSLLMLFVGFAVSACTDTTTGGSSQEAGGLVPPSGADIANQQRSKQLTRLEAKNKVCRAVRENIRAMPALAGTPTLEEQRHYILGRAKGSPVIFRRKPVVDIAALQPYYRALAKALEDPHRVFSTLKKLRKQARFHRKQVRAILMPEGYFYTENAMMARWLVIRFDLNRFFDEDELWLMRGARVHRLTRSKYGYRYAQGPDKGRSASLLLFDRVASKRSDLFPTLHIDFVPAADAHGFDRVQLQ
ncbi:MAG: hypothetical protein CSA75_00540, partial [Sorangium cellulosum]